MFIVRDEHGGKLLIGACEFEVFKRPNPKLYDQLLSAEGWLTSTMEAEVSDQTFFATRDKKQNALNLWKAAKRRALTKLHDYRRQTGKEWLPETLYALQTEMQKEPPTYKRTSSEIKWYEKQAEKITQNL
jgi:hypothetical protein